MKFWLCIFKRKSNPQISKNIFKKWDREEQGKQGVLPVMMFNVDVSLSNITEQHATILIKAMSLSHKDRALIICTFNPDSKSLNILI